MVAATILRRIAAARRQQRDKRAHLLNQALRHHLGSDHRPRRLTVDRRPGRYYVTARDAGRVSFALGPFRRHQQARRFVRSTRREAEKCDPRAWGYAWGTARLRDDWQGEPPIGVLNGALGMQPQETAQTSQKSPPSPVRRIRPSGNRW